MPPPIAHAIGGAVGSALAVLVFYPLERARIELQSQARSESLSASSSGGTSSNSVQNDDLSSCEASINSSNNNKPSPKNQTTTAASSSSSAQRHRKLGLIACLLQLHARKALYNGAVPVITTIAASQFVFFYLHALFKKVLSLGVGRQNSALYSLLTSCMAGVANVFISNPMWVGNMAIVTGQTESQNLFKELNLLRQEKGWKHLWNGTLASLLLVSNPVIQFFGYEEMKRRRLAHHSSSMIKRNGNTLTPMEAFCIGALAKGVATVSTYPLQLAQTVLRLKDTSYRGTFDCLLQLYRAEGIEGWFTGMRTKLLQTVLTAAFTFLT